MQSFIGTVLGSGNPLVAWSCAFSREDSVTIGIPVTYTVEYKFGLGAAPNEPIVTLDDPDCHHLTLTVLQ